MALTITGNLDASTIIAGTLSGDRGVTAGSTSTSFIEYNGQTKTSGQFDGGSTAPTNTTRLNYDGHLYATKFFGDGSGLTGAGSTITNDTTTNADTYYPGMTNNATSGSWTSAVVSSTKLYFNPSTGQLNATNFNSLSDINKKENVSTIENASEKVAALRGVSFTWIETKSPSLGVIAQEVEQVVPEAVSTSSNGEKSVNYAALVGLLLQAVKEQNARIEALEAQLAK